MTARTTHTTVTFTQPFFLGDFGEMLPPGTYDVETDWERLEGLSFQSSRRVLTLIHLPQKPGDRRGPQTLTIDPADLDKALKRDALSHTTAPHR